eukprot:3971856-Pleurochrysis_carterae.AAC.1
MACFRYLATSSNFRVVAEPACISASTLEAFFHKRIEFGATTLYSEWVLVPATDGEINANE